MALKTNSKKPTKIKFDDENATEVKESVVSEEVPKKNKHIKFDNDDDGDDEDVPNANTTSSNGSGGDGGGAGKNQKHAEKKNPSKKSEKNRKNAMDIGTHWYQVVSSFPIIQS